MSQLWRRKMPGVEARKTRLVAGGLAFAMLAGSVLGAVIAARHGPDSREGRDSASPTAVAASTFRFAPHAVPRKVAPIAFEDAVGNRRTLAEFRGKVVLLNIWATWCPPCRREMPALNRLQKALGGADFEVVALSIDRDGVPAVSRFFSEIGIDALSIYVDTTTRGGDALGVTGIPTTLLIGSDGREIGRVIGPAEWDEPAARSVVRRYIDSGNRT